MEPQRLRGISIIAAEAVDSEKPRGIAIPAVRAVVADALLLTRSLSGTFSSAGSVPIRAPLTVDDDDDDDSGSVADERNSVSSDASSYSKGLDSGTDDGFESVSGDADDETELEDVILGGTMVHGALGEEAVGETGDGCDFSGGSVVFRPLAGDVEEETSVNYSSFEEESENSEGVSESEVSEADGVSMKAKVVIPRAILSFDDDEFDEILGNGDEEAALLRVTKAPGDEEAEVEDKTLRFGDTGMVDEPECSDSLIGDVVSTEEEVVEMKDSDKLEDGLISFENIEDLSFGVAPGGCNDFMVENEASIGLDGNSKQLMEKGVIQRSIIKDDGGCSIGEVDALMKAVDVEGVEERAVGLREMGMSDKSEYSGSLTGELVTTEEDMQVDDGLSFETIEGNSVGVAMGDYNEFLLESEGNIVDADKGLDETSSQLVEQGIGQESISKESDSKIDDVSAFEADESMIQGEGSIVLGSRESGDGNTGNMIGESKEHCDTDCSAVSELEKLECEGEPEMGMSSGGFQLTPTLDSVTTRNLEVAGEVEGVVSGCCSTDQKGENDGKRELEDIDKLSLPNEDTISSLRSSFETANVSVENGEQISEQVNKQVNFQSDSEPNQVSVGIEEANLFSVKDVERTMRKNSCVTDNDVTENETQRLIHKNTFMELDEYEGTGNTREKHSESTVQNYSQELSPDNSVQLISERVKERVERTKLLKEKLQMIIRGIELCCESDDDLKSSAVTEVETQLTLVSGEHQTSLENDHVYGGTKIMLPEQELPDGLNFSINVLVIGKTGVGKSATINSIFGETKSPVGAFGVTTKSANYVVGDVRGIQIRILDTPGLMSSATEERFNQEVLMSIKKSMRTFPVDVILYIDRLDENPDNYLLRTITTSLGSSIWRNAIVVLTHAASDVSHSSSYKDFISQRSSLMHQSIRQAVPELSCVDRSRMPGIVLAENNMSSFCENKTSESTCPNWRLNLLILCCSVKTRSKAGPLLKQNTLVEKPDAFVSPLRSFTLFCSLWNALLLGSNQGQTSHSLNDLEEKKRRLLESYPEILWDDQSRECLEQETLPVKNQEPEDEERRNENGKINRGVEKGTALGRVRTRRGRLGFQATKRFGIYLDTSDLHTGFSTGDCRKHEEEEGRILVRMRGSLAVLGLLPMLMSVLASVYGRKNI